MPFSDSASVEEAEVADASAAIQMDFGNYTIGGLIRDRRNYDFENPEYQEVRRQIDARIIQLGYSSAQFAAVDRVIAEKAQWTARTEVSKVDRYGKKYSRIAFFEMYGLRLDQGKLAEWRAGERTSDVDIDPSFPEPPRTWLPWLSDPFTDTSAEPRAWITDGPTPEYDHLLNPEEVDGQRGPWALLEGYIEQSAPADDRRVFTFLRGVFVEVGRVPELCAAFDSVDYPGNHTIPDPQEDYYTYAGEIPWSTRFGTGLRDATGAPIPNRRDALVVHDGTRWRAGIPVEVPVHRFGWEGYHSELNQVSGIVIPAPAVCGHLHLSNRQAEWDLYDSANAVASLHRRFKIDHDAFASHLSYLRCDLLASYLAETGQTLVWLVWGERDLHHWRLSGQMDELRDVWRERQHIHKRRVSWAR